MTKLGLYAGIAYGLAQDGVALLEGQEVSYVEWVRRIVSPRKTSVDYAA